MRAALLLVRSTPPAAAHKTPEPRRLPRELTGPHPAPTRTPTRPLAHSRPRVDDATGYLHYAAAERKKPSYSINLGSVAAIKPSGHSPDVKVSYLTDKGLSTSIHHTSAANGFEICTDSADANLFVYALTEADAAVWVHGLQARAGLTCGIAPSLLDACHSPYHDATAVGDGGLPPEKPLDGGLKAGSAQGWLSKQINGRGVLGVGEGKAWVKRYFRFEPEAGVLSYASSETALEQRKSVQLSTITAVEHEGVEALPGWPSKHALQLRLVSGKAMLLCAANRDDLLMWVEQLSAHVGALQAAALSNRQRATERADTPPDWSSDGVSPGSASLAEPTGFGGGGSIDGEELMRVKIFKPERWSKLGITLTSTLHGNSPPMSSSKMAVVVTNLSSAGIASTAQCGLLIGQRVVQVNATRVFSDRQATDLLRSSVGEITLLVLPARAEDLPLLGAAGVTPAAIAAAAGAAPAGAPLDMARPDGGYQPSSSSPNNNYNPGSIMPVPYVMPAPYGVQPALAQPVGTSPPLCNPSAPPVHTEPHFNTAAAVATTRGAPPSAATATATATPMAILGAAGHFYLQPVELPPGLSLPAGCPPGGTLVYMVPLVGPDGAPAPAPAPASQAERRQQAARGRAPSPAEPTMEARGHAIGGAAGEASEGVSEGRRARRGSRAGEARASPLAPRRAGEMVSSREMAPREVSRESLHEPQQRQAREMATREVSRESLHEPQQRQARELQLHGRFIEDDVLEQSLDSSLDLRM